jgi:hypothetical protein
LDECLSRRVTDFTNKIRAPSPSSPVFPFPELIRSPAMAKHIPGGTASIRELPIFKFANARVYPGPTVCAYDLPKRRHRIAEVCYAA